MKLHTWLKINSLIAIVLLLATLVGAAVPVHAAGETMSLTPASQNAPQGNTINIDVHENSGSTPINAARAYIDYPAGLSIVSANLNTSKWTGPPADTSTPGKIIINAGLLPAMGTSITGDQVIATIVFRGVTAGVANLDYDCNYDVSTCPNGNVMVYTDPVTHNTTAYLPATTGAVANIHASDYLASTQTLLPGQFLYTPNALYKLVMQNDGNLVLYNNNRPMWNSGTSGAGNYLVMQGDGNLVIYSSGNVWRWQTRTGSSNGSAQASNFYVQDDGNLVVYRVAGGAPWNSATGGHPTFSYYGFDRLISNQTMNLNQYLRASDGLHALLLQPDGNLVLYAAGYKVLWSAGVGGRGVNRLVMQSDGNLVLYTASNSAPWHTHTGGQGPSYAVVQTDGNFVVYTNSDVYTWASHTSGGI